MNSIIEKLKSLVEKVKQLPDKTKKIILISAVSAAALILAAALIIIIINITNLPVKQPVSDETNDMNEQKIPTVETATGEEIEDISVYIKKHYGNLYMLPKKITKADCEGYIIKPSKDSPSEYFVGINKDGDIADTYNDYLNFELSQKISEEIKNLLSSQNIPTDECVVRVETLPHERYAANTGNVNILSYINNGKSKINIRLSGASKTPGIFVQTSSKLLNTFKSKNIKCSDISLYFNKSDLEGSEYVLRISSEKDYTPAELSKAIEVSLKDSYISEELSQENADNK